MHKPFRAVIVIPFGILILGIISGCSDDDLTGKVGVLEKINLIATVPENGGITARTGDLKMFFDRIPKSVTVDGRPARIQGNTAIVKIADLPYARSGTEKAYTIEWTNLDDSVAGSKTITFTVIKRATTVEVDPAPGWGDIPTNAEFTLKFDAEVVAMWINGIAAYRSESNWRWSYPSLPYGPMSLNVEWINRDGSADAIRVGPYHVTSIHLNGEPPAITSGTVADGAADVDPAPINAGGFRFDFDEPVTGTIKLTDEAGVDLNWIANVAGQTATLTAVAGQELLNGTTYKIDINVTDGSGSQLAVTITFVTKPQ